MKGLSKVAHDNRPRVGQNPQRMQDKSADKKTYAFSQKKKGNRHKTNKTRERKNAHHQTYDSRRQLTRKGPAGAHTMLRNRAEERSVKVPARNVEVLLMPILVRPRHVFVGNTLAETHVPPFPRGLSKPISVVLHNALLLQLIINDNIHVEQKINSTTANARERGREQSVSGASRDGNNYYELVQAVK